MVKKKLRALLRVFSQPHGNLHLHLAAATIEALRQLKFEFPHSHIVWS
jgi:hypothetical protein